MNETNRHFKGQQEGEVVHCFWRKHWIYMLRDFVYFGIFNGLLVSIIMYHTVIQSIITEYPDSKLFLAVFYVGGGYYLNRFFIKMLNYFLEIGIITNIRIIDHQRSLFFKDIMDSIDLAQIQNLERVGDGILPNLFGYGDIRVFLTASSAVKHLHCLPNVKYHFNTINKQNELRKMMLNRPGAHHEQPKTVINDVAAQVHHMIEF